MNVDKLLLLQEELRDLENAAIHLRFPSTERKTCSNNKTGNRKNWNAWNHSPADLHVYPICSCKE